ncbi:hypothetical protein GN956_G12538 [Arapaima gigas]
MGSQFVSQRAEVCLQTLTVHFYSVTRAALKPQSKRPHLPPQRSRFRARNKGTKESRSHCMAECGGWGLSHVESQH